MQQPVKRAIELVKLATFEHGDDVNEFVGEVEGGVAPNPNWPYQDGNGQ